MSYLLELLAKGLEAGVAEMLERYLRLGAGKPLEQLQELCRRHPDRADLQCQLGMAYLRGMQYAAAIEHLLPACRQDPDHLAARLALAAAYDETGQPAKALEQLQTANQTHPGCPEVIFAIGYCLEKLSRPEAAAEYYRDVIKARADHAPARQRLAAIALLRDDTAEAVAQYQQLRNLDGGDTFVRATLAHLYCRAGRYRDAVQEFEAVIAMEPDNWALMDEEVEALVQAGQARDATERLYRLIETQGPFPDLHLRLADILSGMGRDHEATSHYLAALQADPEYVEARTSLGAHHLIHGRWAEAAESFHNAAELNDRLVTCYVGLAVAQSAAGKPNEAVETLQLAAAIEPNSGVLLQETARLQLKAAVAEEFQRNVQPHDTPPLAEPDLDNDDLLQAQVSRHAEQVQTHPEYADVRYRYGVLLRAEGRLGEAMEQFAKAVEINPAYVDAIIRLGITQQDLGRIDQALETFEKAVELKGEYVDLHYRMALLHTDRRQFAEAVEHMERAAGLSPGNTLIRARLALCLQNMGLMDRAAATWRSLTEMHRARQQGPGAAS
ncbi:MAG: hypothetical protein AMJ81_09700 [Phycisphaerae bacterium SM23_33]|nr:MAG: hypothetical protein AMJ81_09700 [Phycisphaerae bacterium SM23_33]